MIENSPGREVHNLALIPSRHLLSIHINKCAVRFVFMRHGSHFETKFEAAYAALKFTLGRVVLQNRNNMRRGGIFQKYKLGEILDNCENALCLLMSLNISCLNFIFMAPKRRRSIIIIEPKFFFNFIQIIQSKCDSFNANGSFRTHFFAGKYINRASPFGAEKRIRYKQNVFQKHNFVFAL